MSRTPLAFLSYANLDDQHEQGRLTQLRERLSGEVRMHTGQAFEIFQDRKDIVWGQPWEKRISESLAATTFLIPIITPSFFNSNYCRAELERFLKREEELGRGDLILPIYYVNYLVLEDKEELKHDPLAQVVAARQRADWRSLRFKPFDSEQICETLAKMAQQIVAALHRSRKESVRAEAVRRADAAKETPPPQQAKKDSKGNTYSNIFVSTGSCEQNLTRGKKAVVMRAGYCSHPPLQDAPPQHAPAVKTELPTVIVDQNGSGDYTTITKALKAAKPGTRILVRPGLYQEGIVLDKPVEIIGDGRRDDIMIKASDKHTVVFQADNGRLVNLTLRQAGSGKWYGVDITKGGLELEDCDISCQNLACVGIHGSANPILRHNRIHDGKETGVLIWDNGQATLEDNEIFTNASIGLMITRGGNLTLRRNRIAHNGHVGIWVLEIRGGIFEDNDLRGNAKGAWEIAPDCEARVQRRGNKE